MIQKLSILNVVDNSGAKKVACIRVGKGFKRRYANIGDFIVVSVKSLRNKRKSTSKVVKGEICHAIIVRTKKNKYFKNGDSFNFLENSVVLLNRKNKFLFSRIMGGISHFIRYTKYLRIISMSNGLFY